MTYLCCLQECEPLRNLWKTLWKRTSKVVKKRTWLWKSCSRNRGQNAPPRLSTGIYVFKQVIHRAIHRLKAPTNTRNLGFPQGDTQTTTTTVVL